MKRLLFDYSCRDCGEEFEELVERDNPGLVKCPSCASTSTTRLISPVRLDYRLGVKADVFTTLGDRWEKIQRQRQKIEQKRRDSHGE